MAQTSPGAGSVSSLRIGLAPFTPLPTRLTTARMAASPRCSPLCRRSLAFATLPIDAYAEDEDETLPVGGGMNQQKSDRLQDPFVIEDLTDSLSVARSQIVKFDIQHSQWEMEKAKHLDVEESLREMVQELEKKNKAWKQKYDAQADIFEAEREALYDIEHHLKSRIHSLYKVVREHARCKQTPARVPYPIYNFEYQSRPFSSSPKKATDIDQEVAALQLELTSLAEAYSSLQGSHILLQTQLAELQRINRDLQDENERLREAVAIGYIDAGATSLAEDGCGVGMSVGEALGDCFTSHQLPHVHFHPGGCRSDKFTPSSEPPALSFHGETLAELFNTPSGVLLGFNATGDLGFGDDKPVLDFGDIEAGDVDVEDIEVEAVDDEDEGCQSDETVYGEVRDVEDEVAEWSVIRNLATFEDKSCKKLDAATLNHQHCLDTLWTDLTEQHIPRRPVEEDGEDPDKLLSWTNLGGWGKEVEEDGQDPDEEVPSCRTDRIDLTSFVLVFPFFFDLLDLHSPGFFGIDNDTLGTLSIISFAAGPSVLALFPRHSAPCISRRTSPHSTSHLSISHLSTLPPSPTHVSTTRTPSSHQSSCRPTPPHLSSSQPSSKHRTSRHASSPFRDRITSQLTPLSQTPRSDGRFPLLSETLVPGQLCCPSSPSRAWMSHCYELWPRLGVGGPFHGGLGGGVEAMRVVEDGFQFYARGIG